MRARSLLLPADPMDVALGRPRPGVDPHFADEAMWARAHGIPVGVYDHDAATDSEAKAAVRRLPDGIPGPALVRGWMLSAAAYAGLAAAAAARGVEFLVSADRYEAVHHLPGWHGLLGEATAPAAWGAGSELLNTSALPAGPGALKDYVKSVKGRPEASRVDDVHDPLMLAATMAAFLDARGGDLAGGFVVRSWESLDAVEWRTWWAWGDMIATTTHPDTDPVAPESAPDPNLLDRLGEAVRALGHPFVTADLARRDDGVWRVVELGDGQVSDRPRSAGPDMLLDPLFGPAAAGAPCTAR